jgi:hypothetical protein
VPRPRLFVARTAAIFVFFPQEGLRMVLRRWEAVADRLTLPWSGCRSVSPCPFSSWSGPSNRCWDPCPRAPTCANRLPFLPLVKPGRSLILFLFPPSSTDCALGAKFVSNTWQARSRHLPPRPTGTPLALSFHQRPSLACIDLLAQHQLLLLSYSTWPHSPRSVARQFFPRHGSSPGRPLNKTPP